MDRPRIVLMQLAAGGSLTDALVDSLAASCELTRPASDFELERLGGAEPGLDALFLVCASPSQGSPEHEAFCRAVEIARRSLPGVPLIAATEAHSREEVRELLELGVDDFVSPPFLPAIVLPRLWRLIAHAQRSTAPLEQLRARLGLRQLVGRSPVFQAVVDKVPVLARCDATVLITGETGTGKEVFARSVHYVGPRAGHPFVPVNCGAIPIELVENELFGHERAAYTGAHGPHHGLIREAEGGTLFLDEVDSLPPAAQVKLLRFLQDKEYRPLGSTRTRRADVRVIAATNADVLRALDAGRLRHDLYYRLSVLPLALPPLRERREDIPLLAHHFLAQAARELARPVPTLSPTALQVLLQYSWPGNVRELQHVMERAAVMCEGNSVDLGAGILPGGQTREPYTFQQAKQRMVEQFERAYVQDLLQIYHGNITRAARAADKNRRAFFELIRKHHIDAARFRS